MQSSRELHDELANLLTEQRNPASTDLDMLSTEAILRLINAEDKRVPSAVEREIPYIAEAVELIVHAFRNGGRLVYVGAGTSGRLGVIDAAECPPTFGTEPSQIRAIIAGGTAAMFRSQEGAEDDVLQARNDIDALSLNARDVVCGIAASRRTPYVVNAIARARELGARTIYLTTNPRAEFDLEVDVAICPEVGPEVVMGSTRMKSGTAQKFVLNMLTTASMVRLGKVYQNMMVDLQQTNKKLTERSKRIVSLAAGVTYEQAEKLLAAADGHVKAAIVMAMAGVSFGEAKDRLERSGGFVRGAIGGR
jgi:N-acetylmuramic acid 6-phosphate etherase